MRACRSLLLVLALAAPRWSSAQAPAPARKRPPNVILVLADDVGTELLGCYGGTSYRTPALDALAAGGMRFRHAYSMAMCHPSRITLLSGRYPFRFGHPKWGRFPEELAGKTIANALSGSGYATAVAGKWQLARLDEEPHHPTLQGFDQYCLWGWHEGPRYWQPNIRQNGVVRDDVADRYGPDVFLEFVLDFAERQRDCPFFIYYPMVLTHYIDDDLDPPAPFGPGRNRYESYAEMVQAMDERVGRLIEGLERLGLRENTLVLFVGDNGTSGFNISHFEDGEAVHVPVVSVRGDRLITGGKETLGDAGTHVPLIASWPGTIEGGQVVDDLVDLSDFFPTLVELARADVFPGVELDGQSFVSCLRGEPGPRRTWVFAERKGERRFFFGKRQWPHFVRDQRWKLYGDGKLYDMLKDPEERKPVASSPEARAARSRLSKALDELGLKD